MLVLFPPIKPYQTQLVPVSDGYQIYLEESGNIQGIPVLYVHGGPGGGSKPDHRRFFDPSLYRIILFDQRGCGQSTPFGHLKSNTTQKLIEDIETIRKHLSIAKWVLFGSSWGAALALLYAEAYPDTLSKLLLCGTTLCREQELEWLYQAGGASRLFPDEWDHFRNHIPKDEQGDLVKAYYHRLHGKDELAQLSAAKAWGQWHAVCSTLQPNPNYVAECTAHAHLIMNIARLQTHYFSQKVFLTPNQILNDIHPLTNIPSIIVHGRYDVIVPVDNAYELHRVWPSSELQIVRDAGHSSSEPGTIHALISATNQIAHELNRDLPLIN